MNISGAVRWSVSMLIILFPVLVWISRLLNRDLENEPEKHAIAVRRWLIHFTLFVAGITILVDLVTLVYNFLGGELSLRFLLKVLSVLIVAGLVFGYYLLEVKWETGTMPKKMRMMLITAIAIVTVSVIGGFFLAGSPTRERDRQFDERRVNDLSYIQNEVTNYWSLKQKLPADFGALENPLRGFKASADPETGVAYEYKTTSALTFELCATFATDSASSPKTAVIYPEPFGGNSWLHGAGRVCFERTIDPELYPKQ